MIPAALTATGLAASFRSLGLQAGDRVVVHSSLRAMGVIEGGAAVAVAALLEVVGPGGLVVAPTFTYSTPAFDPGVTPGRSGALGEALRRRPEAVRSLHPFYSVAAAGAGAGELCEGDHLLAAASAGSPLDRLAAAGGLVLLLGVGHTSNTTVHVGEFHAQAPYLDIPFDPGWPAQAEISDRGELLHVSYELFPGCSRAFGALELPLRERGAIRDGRVGRSFAQLVPGSAVIEETVALLASGAAALLCTDPHCYRCSLARERPGARLD